MNEPAPRYWFHAKRYGWGWGLPASWEGWAVLAAFAVLVSAAVIAFPVEAKPVEFFASVFALAAGLVYVCWRKGPPPKWRWGDRIP